MVSAVENLNTGTALTRRSLMRPENHRYVATAIKTMLLVVKDIRCIQFTSYAQMARMTRAVAVNNEKHRQDQEDFFRTHVPRPKTAFSARGAQGRRSRTFPPRNQTQGRRFFSFRYAIITKEHPRICSRTTFSLSQKTTTLRCYL